MSAAATSITAPAEDLPDWLSPILVKELRQGLKSRLFVTAFLLLQAGLVILLMLEAVASDVSHGHSSDLRFYEQFFWVILGGALYLLLPIRGLFAITEEVKAQTLDLVRLTHLGAFRIMFGKWLALTSLSALLVLSVLPYVLLRYYLGSVEIWDDIKTVGGLFLTSTSFIATAIALSAIPTLVRILLIIVLVLGLFSLGSAFAVAMAFSGGGRGSFFSSMAFSAWGNSWIALINTVLNVVFFLEFAASRIAAPSENHAFLKRTGALAVAAALLGCALLQWTIATRILLISLSPLFVWTVIESLTEFTSHLPSIYEPFYRRGWLGRALAFVLCPGWATGVIFTLLLSTVCWFAYVHLSPTFTVLSGSSAASAPSFWVGFGESEMKLGIFWQAALMALILPVIPIQLFRIARHRLWFTFFFHFATVILFWVFAMMPRDESLPSWLGVFPGAFYFALLRNIGGDAPIQSAVLTFHLATIIYGCVILLFMAREFLVIMRVERESKLSPELPPALREQPLAPHPYDSLS